MKKRSLASAIAMLVVSAIVLTSATFAWFAAGSTATVASITATVENTNTTLSVAPNINAKSDYKNIFTNEVKDTYYTLPEKLNPVSLRPVFDSETGAIKDVKISKVTLNNSTFNGFQDVTDSTNDFLKYSFKVAFLNNDANAKNVYINPVFNSNEKNFTYGLIVVTYNGTSNYYLYTGTSGDHYLPVKAITNSAAGGIFDKNGNSIIDANDNLEGKAVVVASDLDGDINNTFNSTAKNLNEEKIYLAQNVAANGGEILKTAPVEVTVYVWAEGQNSNCQGSVAGTTDTGFSAMSILTENYVAPPVVDQD